MSKRTFKEVRYQLRIKEDSDNLVMKEETYNRLSNQKLSSGVYSQVSRLFSGKIIYGVYMGKVCVRCGNDDSGFYKCKRNRDGLNSLCVSCVKTRVIRPIFSHESVKGIEGEEWKDYNGIKVSNFGRIINKKGSLSLGISQSKRYFYAWVKDDTGRNVKILVHVLVYKLFGKSDFEGVVRHKDDNGLNNHIENLIHGTFYDNSQDAKKNGKILKGSDKPCSVLREEDVLRIIEFKEQGLSDLEVGGIFGVSRRAVNMIRDGSTWSHITGIKKEYGYEDMKIVYELVKEGRCSKEIQKISGYYSRKVSKIRSLINEGWKP